eukprot:TRINITY_DN34689_c0_g1_i2.p1 TRINITY_DN34689_c0_g1~~TRINITY_DN34689_c0_g1_i2.p1  ORF type:complete len:105 (-),score=13.08 TRINITY_DN34689_c0_g1_i2:8-322(-)
MESKKTKAKIFAPKGRLDSLSDTHRRQSVGGVLQKEGPSSDGIRNPGRPDRRCPVQCAAEGRREAVRAVQELEVKRERRKKKNRKNNEVKKKKYGKGLKKQVMR